MPFFRRKSQNRRDLSAVGTPTSRDHKAEDSNLTFHAPARNSADDQFQNVNSLLVVVRKLLYLFAITVDARISSVIQCRFRNLQSRCLQDFCRLRAGKIPAFETLDDEVAVGASQPERASLTAAGSFSAYYRRASLSIYSECVLIAPRKHLSLPLSRALLLSLRGGSVALGRRT